MKDAHQSPDTHARAGDTLRLLPGVHQLSAELTLDRPLRILSVAEADRVLCAWDDGGATLPLHASTEAPRPQPAWVRAASEPEELQTEFSFAPAPEAD